MKFGRYPQGPNGEEKEIEWKVLDNKDGELLLLSEECLDCKKYNEEWADVTWETCTLRKWLNDEFYNKAFNSQEKAKILTTSVTADKNPMCSTNQGKDTNDKVFLLSAKEIKKYFKDDKSMIAKPTGFAVSKGAYREKWNHSGYYWLRTVGAYMDQSMYVYPSGGYESAGAETTSEKGGVRVAIKIRL